MVMRILSLDKPSGSLAGRASAAAAATAATASAAAALGASTLLAGALSTLALSELLKDLLQLLHPPAAALFATTAAATELR